MSKNQKTIEFALQTADMVPKYVLFTFVRLRILVVMLVLHAQGLGRITLQDDYPKQVTLQHQRQYR